MRWSSAFVWAFLFVGCSDAVLQSPPPISSNPANRDAGEEATDDAGSEPGSDGGPVAPPPAGSSNLRVVAANISSGEGSNYDPGEGIRMFKGLRPDVALVQELNYGSNSKADLDSFVSDAFGAEYTYTREDGAAIDIPNGVVSRYPIAESGRWVDPQVKNRGFVWAKIDVPGPQDLWAVSVHFLTTSSGNRSSEATALVAELDAVVGQGDFVVVGGDFNTTGRAEQCVVKLGKYLTIDAGLPVDQAGNDFTNAPRNAPYDWVLASPSLGAFQVPTVIGTESFPNGLVFDSRVFTPLSAVPPVQKTDSAALNMQHMPVVKDFALAADR